ncbi:hypothetical protein J7I94_09460 [Streptomyces sp. ISL-12]|uniref:hypothetical protein n=1 Tax=Streptomyces sp. ISL-12 TaxID=2819177 RepID=UPI001BE76B65|nr:hypothetical protein [Streptomyces sp. ISL-12]MBT2410785.1 hypothetical protein [Streptomyces sp. ISL-12]
MKTFRYRKRSPLGGLAADITAAADATGPIPRHATQIGRSLWMEPPASWPHWRDTAWMMYGLSLHSESLNRLHPQGLTVKVQNLSFPTSDYVPEVAAFVMEGWTREVFDLTPAGISVEYDTTNRRYIFSWGNGMPFSDEASGVPVSHAW